jgi:enamine deaminase RidA (YjgF/YER057c/UK114 family)
MIFEKLKQLGIELPEVTPPLASYIPAKRSGNMIFISGQLPMQDGKLLMTGPMTPARSIDEAQRAMARCIINGLAAASTVVSIDSIRGVVRLGAFVSSSHDFIDQHKVANGASDLAKEIFGPSGTHARSAIGVPSLPLNATVELEIVFEI